MHIILNIPLIFRPPRQNDSRSCPLVRALRLSTVQHLCDLRSHQYRQHRSGGTDGAGHAVRDGEIAGARRGQVVRQEGDVFHDRGDVQPTVVDDRVARAEGREEDGEVERNRHAAVLLEEPLEVLRGDLAPRLSPLVAPSQRCWWRR